MEFDANGVKVNVNPNELSDEMLTGLAYEVVEAAQARGLELPGAFVGPLATAEALDAPVVEAPIMTTEGLLESFDSAYRTYSFSVDTVNAVRDEAKGRKKDKPAPVETVSADTIRAEVEALLADENVLADLQADIDHFTKSPEVDSPDPGFEIVIVPEGLATADEHALAQAVQAKIPGNYTEPYLRSDRYNDKREQQPTGKGYRIAFAPRHYNVPRGTAANQTAWMNTQNQDLTSTELQTATDGEALAFITTLADQAELDDDSTRFDQTYFRRFDQAPVDGFVSSVYARGNGGLGLGGSGVHFGNSLRALVVPKA